MILHILEGADPSIGVLSLETGDVKVLFQPGFYPHYVPTGHLIYTWDGELLAAPFDLETLEVTGSFTRVLEGLWRWQYSVSENGTLVYVPDPGRSGSTLVWVDRQGEQQPATEMRRNFTSVRFSPDGKRLAVSLGSRTKAELWIYEIDRDILSPLKTGVGWGPIWNPDGTRLAFASVGDNQQFSLFWMAADGSGEAEQLTNADYTQNPYSWSPDGKVLAFRQFTARRGGDIFLLPLGGEPTPFLAMEEFEETRSLSDFRRKSFFFNNSDFLT